MLKFWAKTQSTIALSSAEAELAGMVKAAAEGLGVLSLLRDFGLDRRAVVATDSSAALGIANRQGVGRVRHLDVQ